MDDTIGCYYKRSTNEIWFTVNNKYIGVAIKDDSLKDKILYPTVMPSKGTIITFKDRLTSQ